VKKKGERQYTHLGNKTELVIDEIDDSLKRSVGVLIPFQCGCGFSFCQSIIVSIYINCILKTPVYIYIPLASKWRFRPCGVIRQFFDFRGNKESKDKMASEVSTSLNMQLEEREY
jgi:hypothetical protein